MEKLTEFLEKHVAIQIAIWLIGGIALVLVIKSL